MKKILTLICFGVFFGAYSQAQDSTEVVSSSWDYSLPIWGKKASDLGYKLQLPYGLNVMYVNSMVDLNVSKFRLGIGDGTYQDLINEKVNEETLNFTKTRAYFNGLNFRPDIWLFPFMNVYGIITTGNGATEVELSPRIPYGDGNDVLELPEFGSKVDFTANAYGLGTTLIYGFGRNYFVSGDVNYSWTFSEIIDGSVGVITASGRIGEHWDLGKKKNKKLAVYVGFMFRDFTNTDGTRGSIKFSEALPEVEQNINNGIDARVADNISQIEANNTLIDELNPVKDREQIADLRAQNRVLGIKNTGLTSLQNGLDESGVYDTEIRYEIKKEMIQNWTVEFGASYNFTEHWAFRSEFGVSKSQTLILAGISYRFGLKF